MTTDIYWKFHSIISIDSSTVSKMMQLKRLIVRCERTKCRVCKMMEIILNNINIHVYIVLNFKGMEKLETTKSHFDKE